MIDILSWNTWINQNAVILGKWNMLVQRFVTVGIRIRQGSCFQQSAGIPRRGMSERCSQLPSGRWLKSGAWTAFRVAEFSCFLTHQAIMVIFLAHEGIPNHRYYCVQFLPG